MKKFLFIFLMLPLFTFSQWRNSSSFPNKLYYIDFLNPKEKSVSIDTSRLGSTILQYRSFSTKGQMIDVIHTQSLTDYLQFDLTFRKFSQEGVFSREALKLYDVVSNISFHNKKSTYDFDAILSYQKIRMNENGGIVDYTIEDYDDPLLYQTNLVSSENYSKNRFHSLSQNFNFTSNWSLINKFSILRAQRIYSDYDLSSAFYENNFINNVSFRDSLSHSFLTNSIGLRYSDFSLAHIIQMRNNFLHTIDSTDFDNGIVFTYSNSNLGLTSDVKFFESSQYSFTADKTLNNKKTIQLLSISAKRYRTPIFYNTYYSNHFIFDNNFIQESRQMFKYGLSSNKFSLNSSISHYQDHIYLNENASYSQNYSSILYFDNTLSFDWRLLNFYGSSTLQYQWSDNPDIFRYPDINTSFSLWFQGAFFNELLDFKIGGKINYFTPYYAKLYNPALASYQLQNIHEIGGLPFISSFINLKVNSMNIDIQFLNLNELISNSPHYFMPNYPSQPTSIKLSLIWELKN